MGRTLIIGYGNTLCGDDGLGWYAAQRLTERLRRDDVEVLATQQLTIELAEKVTDADYVIFIDANADDPPGVLRCRRVEFTGPEASPFSHHVSPETLVACARLLFGRCPEAVTLSVAGESFEHGEGLSQKVRSVFPVLIDCVEKMIE